MALRPTGPGDPQVPAPRRRPASEPASAPSGLLPAATRSRPEPGFRLKAAVSPEEIDRQIQRLMSLIANDNIDPDAPPGSYLNLLV